MKSEDSVLLKRIGLLDAPHHQSLPFWFRLKRRIAEYRSLTVVPKAASDSLIADYYKTNRAEIIRDQESLLEKQRALENTPIRASIISLSACADNEQTVQKGNGGDFTKMVYMGATDSNVKNLSQLFERVQELANNGRLSATPQWHSLGPQDARTSFLPPFQPDHD